MTFSCPTCLSPGVMLDELPAARACVTCATSGWPAAEMFYAANRYSGSAVAGDMRVVKGAGTAVWVASSSVNYLRGAEQLPAYKYTGSLVEQLAELTGMPAVAAAGTPAGRPVVDSPDEALTDAVHPLVRPARLVVDVRGMRDRSFDIGIGLGPRPGQVSPRFVGALTLAAQSRGLTVAVNVPFAAHQPWTLTSHAQREWGADALQIQVPVGLRSPLEAPDRASLLLGALRQAAAAIS